MANVFERISDIMSSNVHALLDKCENPEKMLDQNMRKAVEDLASLKEAAAQLKADQKAAQRNYDAAVRKMQAEHGFAVNAMKAGDEAAAAKFLQSEAAIKASEVDTAQRVLDAANANYAKIEQAHNKLADDINFMKNRMNSIKGTMRAAKASEKVARMTDVNQGYSESFSKYAEKAQRMLDVAESKIEMNAQPLDEMAGLRQKYAGGMGTDVSAALAGLKAECGMAGAAQDAAMDDALAQLREEAGTN